MDKWNKKYLVYGLGETMDRYELKDLMDATKEEVGKGVVENYYLQLFKKQEACCLIKVWEC